MSKFKGMVRQTVSAHRDNLNGLSRVATYDEMINEIQHPTDKIVLPNRLARRLRETPQLSQLDDINESELAEQHDKISVNKMRDAEIGRMRHQHIPPSMARHFHSRSSLSSLSDESGMAEMGSSRDGDTSPWGSAFEFESVSDFYMPRIDESTRKKFRLPKEVLDDLHRRAGFGQILPGEDPDDDISPTSPMFDPNDPVVKSLMDYRSVLNPPLINPGNPEMMRHIEDARRSVLVPGGGQQPLPIGDRREQQPLPIGPPVSHAPQGGRTVWSVIDGVADAAHHISPESDPYGIYYGYKGARAFVQELQKFGKYFTKPTPQIQDSTASGSGLTPEQRASGQQRAIAPAGDAEGTGFLGASGEVKTPFKPYKSKAIEGPSQPLPVRKRMYGKTRVVESKRVIPSKANIQIIHEAFQEVRNRKKIPDDIMHDYNTLFYDYKHLKGADKRSRLREMQHLYKAHIYSKGY